MNLTLNQEEIQQAIRDFLQKNYTSHIEVVSMNMIGSRSKEGYSLEVDIALNSVAYHGNVPKSRTITEFKYTPTQEELAEQSTEAINNLFDSKIDKIKDKTLSDKDKQIIDAVVKNMDKYIDNPSKELKEIIDSALDNCSDKQLSGISEYPIYAKYQALLYASYPDKDETEETENTDEVENIVEETEQPKEEEEKEEPKVEEQKPKETRQLFTTSSIFS